MAVTFRKRQKFPERWTIAVAAQIYQLLNSEQEQEHDMLGVVPGGLAESILPPIRDQAVEPGLNLSR